jgi:hydroxyethylthiazole kinase-like uncharacterized protein yjeF
MLLRIRRAFAVVDGPPVHLEAGLRCIEQQAAARLPPHTLMRRAGVALARLARARFPHARRVLVLCGPGNNGGDGMIAAAELQRHGVQVELLLAACGDPRAPDPARHPEDWRWAHGVALAAGLNPIAWADPAAKDAWQDAELVLDALLGIGLRRAPDGEIGAAIAALAGISAPVLAADLPSGLAADTGCAPGAVVQAAVTLTLLGLKPGLFGGPAAGTCGELWFDDLDVAAPAGGAVQPGTAQSGVARPAAHLSPGAAAWAALPPLHAAAHKGARGDVQVFGGAAGMSGAVLLSARAALALGAGRVFAAMLDPAAPTLDPLRPELMLRRPQALLRQMLDAPTPGCAVFGPGAGLGDDARDLLAQLLTLERPMVIDADGLNLLAAQDRNGALWSALRARRVPAWLTPHPREATALLGLDAAAVQADRLQAARQLAALSGAHCVLKGAGSVIAARDGSLWINPSGNGLLATAGSGDVLAGALAACIARSADAGAGPGLAAVWLHGAAADLAQREGRALRADAIADWMLSTAARSV